MDSAQRATMSKEDLKIIDQYEFEKRTDQKFLRRKIHDLVEIAKDVRREELAEKRERLRALLQSEEAAFEAEYIGNVQAKVSSDIQARTDRLVEIQKETGKKVEEMIQLKKAQQYMSSCDEIRLKLRQELLCESKQTQLAQIEEKRRLAEEERRQNCLWEQVAKKRNTELLLMDHCKAMRKEAETLENFEILQQQVEQSRQLREQLKKEELEERLNAEAKLQAELEMEKQALAGEAGKRLQQARLLQKQHLEAMELKKKRTQKEIAYDRMFEQAIDAQYKREQDEIAARISRVREATLTYLKYLKDLKQERLQAECEYENALLEFQKKANERKDKLRREERERKAAEAKKAHQELLDQICQNQIRRIYEQKNEYLDAMDARQRWECDVCRDNEKQKARELFAWNYGIELKDQMAAIEAYKIEEQKRFKLELERIERDTLYCDEMMQKFMSGEVQYLKAHPNWSLICCSCLKK